jgi:hypothetical protein
MFQIENTMDIQHKTQRYFWAMWPYVFIDHQEKYIYPLRFKK